MFPNSKVKKIALWSFVIMVLFIGTIGTVYVMGGFSGIDDITNVITRDINTEKTLSLGSTKDILIDTVSEDINIIPSDTGDIKVHLYGSFSSSKSTVPELETVDNQNQIKINIKHPNITGFNFSNNSLKLDIYMPKTYSENISINTVSGDLKFDSFNLNNFKYSSVSGDMSTSSLSTKDFTMSTTSGNALIKSFGGNLSFGSVSGNLDVEYGNFNNSIKINTTSGDSKIKLPGNSEFNLDFSSVSGDTKSDFPVNTDDGPGNHLTKGSLGNSSNRIEIDSVSGDLELLKQNVNSN